MISALLTARRGPLYFRVDLSASSLLASLLFSSIGFVAFTYGKRTGHFQIMALGGVLMAYSYFTPGATWTWLVGAGLTGMLVYLRD
jgi:predicted phage tail protein